MNRKFPRFIPIGILVVTAILALSTFGVLAAGSNENSAGQASSQVADLSGFQQAVKDLIIVMSGSFPGHVHITGKVVSIDGSVWTVGDRKLITDANTKITGSPVVGDMVRVTGTLQTDGSYLALAIEKIPSAVHFSGKVISITGAVWVIGGKTVSTDANTKIIGSPVVGDTVMVTATLQADGSLLATSIDKVVKPVIFVGKVASISGGVWMVGDKKVVTDSNTKVSGSPAVGDVVWVAAVLQSDGSYLASEIRKVMSDDQDFVHFSGMVASISGSVWTINAKQVATDANTRIIGSPVVGDEVRVVAALQPDGSLLAVMIMKASSNDEQGEKLEFTAKLTAINGSTWTIGKRLVTVDPNTKINGSPVIGDLIHVVANRQPDRSLLALTIDVVIRHCDRGDDQNASCKHVTPTPRPTKTPTVSPTVIGTLPTMLPGPTSTLIATPMPYPPHGATPTPDPTHASPPGSNNGPGHGRRRP